MGRYINNIPLSVPAETVFNQINQYLATEGYEYTQYNNENVFKKGKGLMAGPTFIKVSIYETNIVIEAWMKYAVLPGVYVGEFDLNSTFGFAIIAKLKERVAYVESIIYNYSTQAFNNAPASPVNFSQTNAQNMNVPPQNSGAAPQYNDTQPQGFNAAPQMVMNGVPQGINPANVSKKEFIDNYAPISVKKDIRNAAICCYVCAVISAVSAIFINPLGLIDTVLLVAPALGMHIGKSKVCAIILLVLSVADCILSTILTGRLSGWLWIVAAAIAVVSFSKIDKQYQQFTSYNNNQFNNNIQ